MDTVAVVTGTRAEYGLLSPVVDACRARGLDAEYLVTGMHLESAFGHTVREIEAGSVPIRARIPMHVPGDSPLANARSIARGIDGIAEALDAWKPDVVLVLGDRTEAFAAAVAAAALDRVVAHLHGGERTRGGLDESMRHAITKLAHLHFTATEASRERVLRLGEPEDRVFTVGAPGLDRLLDIPRPDRATLSAELGVEIPNRYWLLLQHSVSTDWDTAANEIELTMNALHATDLPVIAIEPNSDPGGDRIRRAIASAVDRHGWLSFASLERHQYLGLMERATAIVGNSSSAIIEAPSLGTPAVNIGLRQEGRERGNNVLDVPFELGAIRDALDRCRHDRAFLECCRRRENPYGDGRASERVATLLAELTPDRSLLRKQITH